jgi:hypothetical protein
MNKNKQGVKAGQDKTKDLQQIKAEEKQHEIENQI